MPKKYYCSNCGTRLVVTRKALPKYATIIELVEYHECPDEPVEFDLEPIPVPRPPVEDKDKFVHQLNGLGVKADLPENRVLLEPLGDKRDKEHIKKEKSSAPPTVLDYINRVPISSPANEPIDLDSPEGD